MNFMVEIIRRKRDGNKDYSSLEIIIKMLIYCRD